MATQPFVLSLAEGQWAKPKN